MYVERCQHQRRGCERLHHGSRLSHVPQRLCSVATICPHVTQFVAFSRSFSRSAHLPFDTHSPSLILEPASCLFSHFLSHLLHACMITTAAGGHHSIKGRIKKKKNRGAGISKEQQHMLAHFREQHPGRERTTSMCIIFWFQLIQWMRSERKHIEDFRIHLLHSQHPSQTSEWQCVTVIVNHLQVLSGIFT